MGRTRAGILVSTWGQPHLQGHVWEPAPGWTQAGPSLGDAGLGLDWPVQGGEERRGSGCGGGVVLWPAHPAQRTRVLLAGSAGGTLFRLWH